MLQKKEMMVIFLVGVLCVSTLWGEDGQRRSSGRSQMQAVSEEQKASDPYKDVSVLVEAFVVRVSNAALAEGGVNPIGQSPEGISILKILWCLKDSEKAEVVSGTKLMARQKQEAESSNRKKFYVKFERVNRMQGKEGPVESKDINFSEYSSGISFKIRPSVKEETAVSFDYSYSQSDVKEPREDMSAPPEMLSYDWQGVVSVQSGKPVIAGAVQGLDETTFLILTATIQKMQD